MPAWKRCRQSSAPRANAPAAASSNSLPRPSATVIPGWRTRAVKRFFDWCDKHHLGLEDIEPIAIAAYIEELGSEIAKPSVKQHLAAIRQLFDYLVTGGILVSTPAGSVRGPKYVVTRGKTPVLSSKEMRQLLNSIDTSELIGLRDRALLGLMGYTFARVSAVVTLRVEDYFQQGRRSWLRLHEKGGKRHEAPCHHSLDEYLDAWIAAAGIGDDKKGPLFRSFKKGDKFTGNPMIRSDVLYMIKRRAKGAALPYSTCCHTFRATGITAYLQNGGTLEHAQQIAAHQSPAPAAEAVHLKIVDHLILSNDSFSFRKAGAVMTISPLICKHYPDLNEDQRAVVGHGEGPLLIIAGPGSGKTYSIVLRALNLLLLEKAQPKQLVLCTFTEKAACVLAARQKRLSFGSSGRSRHGCCAILSGSRCERR